MFFIHFVNLILGESTRVTTPTAIESSLPWKRVDDDGDGDGGAVKQNEFPAWASNKEYIAYNSPSATFLGKIYDHLVCLFELCLRSIIFKVN